jgi:putative SOS response-associated peptidase YedK
MCGRTSLFTPQSVIEERFDAEAVRPLAPRYNIAPREDLAVIRNDSPDRIELLEWGLLPAWVDDPESFSYPINARAETVAEKPTFREAFERRRCLVLADGFYEWADTPTGKQPYRVQRVDGAPFAMAGLWERWEGAGDTRETVTVVTTEPNAVVEPLHHRMAVLLDEAGSETWLSDADPETHRSVLGPAPAEELTAYPISSAVNDPSNDYPEIIEEVDPDEQTTFGDFRSV